MPHVSDNCTTSQTCIRLRQRLARASCTDQPAYISPPQRSAILTNLLASSTLTKPTLNKQTTMNSGLRNPYNRTPSFDLTPAFNAVKGVFMPDRSWPRPDPEKLVLSDFRKKQAEAIARAPRTRKASLKSVDSTESGSSAKTSSFLLEYVFPEKELSPVQRFIVRVLSKSPSYREKQRCKAIRARVYRKEALPLADAFTASQYHANGQGGSELRFVAHSKQKLEVRV
ncbi:hypothetical protein MKEN_01147900 [Mycena kentingensis (nom. inval.)]|nr:hypothetical protein MKEN_01147900 [Mycena kentingensis (nom. inval.)]